MIIDFEWTKEKDWQRHYNYIKPEENKYTQSPQGKIIGFEWNSRLDTQKQYNYEEIDPNPYEPIKQGNIIGFEWNKDDDIQRQYGYIYYHSQGYWVSPTIDLGSNAKSIQAILGDLLAPEGTSASIYLSESEDGDNFSEYVSISLTDDLKLDTSRYVKIKIEMSSAGNSGENQSTNSTPYVYNLQIDYNLLEGDRPTLYASRDDGDTWLEVSEDKLKDISSLPEGNKLRVKAVLENGQELYGLSYSWI